MRLPSTGLLAAATLLLVAGCTNADSEPSAADPATAPSPSVSDASPSASPTPTPRPTPEEEATEDAEPLPTAPDRVSLPTLMGEEFTGSRIRITREVGDFGAYTRNEITYRSGDLTISGILNVPDGKGPFPAIVLNHGYIEPSIYVTGQGLSREQDYLAREGFVVLHTDYRGHAASEDSSALDRETRLGYTRDAINAVKSLERLPYVDPDRLAMLGRSMGGAVTYNALVAQPGLVDAGIVFAPVSSRFMDNFNRWTRPERPDSAQEMFQRFGTPDESRAFYRGLSARTYFDRITEPVLIHHGTLDDSCPIRWSRETQRLLEQEGKRSTLEIYEGEQHAFGPQWPESMRRTVRFLRNQLNA